MNSVVEMEEKKKEEGSVVPWLIILGVFFIFIVIGLWVWEVYKNKEERKAYQDRLRKRKIKLQEIISKKKTLSLKLNKLVYRYFFFARLVLVFLYLKTNHSVALLIYRNEPKLSFNDMLGILLNWNEVFIIIFSLLVFVTFNSFDALKFFIEEIRSWIEIEVYGKYFKIHDIINTDEKKLIKLENEIMSYN